MFPQNSAIVLPTRGLPKSLKSALGCPGPENYLSKDMKGLAAFWPEAKYGKMRIEGRDPVNA
jgi:hypothetical protein